MMIVDKNKCIGCGLCVKDCFLNDIELIDDKAHIKNETCIKCGHCIAICPKNAVSTDDYNMDDVKEYNKETFDIEPENLLNFIKFRRTIRNFKDKDVENDKLLKIIEAGRFTQTGSNSQNVSYVVVKDKIAELRDLVLETLKNMGEYILNNPTEENIQYRTYANMWIGMYNENKDPSNKKDRLFFNAPSLIMIVSDSQVNASLASSNMELMTDALGLGTFFSGFFVRAAQENKAIKELLGLKETEQIVTCMVIGYPNVKFQRTVPRKEASITWR
ncbi:nitroreductase [Clostridium baratii]|uniref:nitroreductase family protein n=1 Tax=Clostridium baratii TaxID=1561 RepID=UPI0009A4426C|nr:nitroreductase family protein [Clostridium baratii]OPF50522.1 nitroreductase [Clostridium baratii]OPF54232.1 nitroreductase [Clostridium baratii]OPF58797.1 nitroreductase [Clostridium baratii]OPF58831.1 nitroreductase [Clostridium baratii]